MATKSHLNINEASKLCGLSPSVLRIWELRYNWPAPMRRANGYRAYSQPQVEELKRMAELVKAGLPISSLIVEGMPRWPAANPNAGRKTLAATRSIAKPADRQVAQLQGDLIDAIENRQASLVKEVLQRCVWQVRPVDEVQLFFVPTMVGIAELAQSQRTLVGVEELRALIIQRCDQLMRPFNKHQDDTLWVYPVAERDHALATMVALLLNQRGHAAKPWIDSVLPATGPVLAVSEDGFEGLPSFGARLIGRLSPLGEEEATSLLEVVGDTPLPWHAEVV